MLSFLRRRWIGPKRIGAGGRRGQAVTEFALVFPLLMLAVTGQVAFGLAFHYYMVLTNAVNVGAQLLAISRGQTSDPCSTASTAVQNAAFDLTSSSLSFTFIIDGTTYTGTTCTAGTASMVQGASAEVSVTYPCTLTIYSMSIPSCTLRAQTTELIQ
jgi:Flp pilus assembly protein TadG